METQTDLKAVSYLVTINKAPSTVMSKIKNQADFKTKLRLFHLVRFISPESHALHQTDP